MRLPALPLLFVGILSLLAAPAAAHDFWIEPSSYHAKAGQPVQVGLRVGDKFVGEPVPRNAEKIERFIMVSPAGEKPIIGIDGKDPAGVLRPEQDGLLVLGYRSKNSAIELEPAKFESYLKEEGLEKVIALRRERGESSKSAREVYSRCAKSLIRVGDAEASTAGFDRRLGFTLELVPENNPLALRHDEELRVRLLFDDKPLEGALVVAIGRDEKTPMSQRTDADGRVKLRLARPGVWLIKAVHMTRAPAGVDADWQSVWASLTFELPTRD